MANPQYSNSELDEIATRSDPADIPGLVAALKDADAALAHPMRLERANRALMAYLGRIDLTQSPDGLVREWGHTLVSDWTRFALRLGYVTESAGVYKLTRRGERTLSDHLRSLTADDL